MGYLVQGRLEISIYIDDVEYPLQDTNVLNYLHITANVTTAYPTMQMSITDNARMLDSIGLQDGIPIRIVVKGNQSNTQTFFFRKFHHITPSTSPTSIYVIDGYYDAPLWYNGSTNTNVRGTTDSVISNIAQQCSLKYEGTATNDSQLWTPQNKSWSTFANDLCNNGYMDDTSCMCLALDLDGTLKYKNVNNLPQPTHKILAYDYAEDAVTAVDFQPSANSGFNNAISGYWNTRVAQSITADTQYVNELAFKPDSKSPLYNKTLKGKMKAGAVRFSPIDVGNNHVNYEKASYQNTRYRNLYSMGLQILLTQQTQFKLFEKVVFSVQKEDRSQDVSASGTYTITGRALFINAANYAEKLQVVRHGTNENYTDG